MRDMNKFKLEVFNIMNKNSSGVNFDVVQARYIHSIRTAKLCCKIAEDMKLGDSYIELAYLSGLYHDVCKLSSNNHSYDAYKILSENSMIKNNDIVLNSILMHSAKYINIVDYNFIGDILRDADIIDKLSFDSICKSISDCKNLIKRLETLYTKREVLKMYECKCTESVKYFDKGMQTLNKFIEDLEDCII